MAFGIAAVSCFAAEAAAEKISSRYSDFNPAKCKTLLQDTESESVILACTGLKGWPVQYWEGDLRGLIAFGKNAPAQCSAAQSFSQFNSPGTRIEWRLSNGKPFATIFRWTTDNGIDGTKAQWLVVTKLDGRNTCRTAIIDAALPHSNKIARQRADQTRNFNCETGLPEIVSRQSLDPKDFLTGSPCGTGPFREE